MLVAGCHCAEFRYNECHNGKSYNAECCYAECHYAECHYTECRYAECRYAECRWVVNRPSSSRKGRRALPEWALPCLRFPADFWRIRARERGCLDRARSSRNSTSSSGFRPSHNFTKKLIILLQKLIHILI